MFFSVGSGTGPEIRAPVRRAVSTILVADWSMTWWSYAFRRILTFCRRILYRTPCELRVERRASSVERGTGRSGPQYLTLNDQRSTIRRGSAGIRRAPLVVGYSMTLETIPAPTVWPPSRIAN